MNDIGMFVGEFYSKHKKDIEELEIIVDLLSVKNENMCFYRVVHSNIGNNYVMIVDNWLREEANKIDMEINMTHVSLNTIYNSNYGYSHIVKPQISYVRIDLVRKTGII